MRSDIRQALEMGNHYALNDQWKPAGSAYLEAIRLILDGISTDEWEELRQDHELYPVLKKRDGKDTGIDAIDALKRLREEQGVEERLRWVGVLKDPSGSYGLFQFIPSTWGTTPYANEAIFDAWASAHATGWMWSVGRRNHWVCQ